jgi:pyrimidine operon attenuation protein / uracil phosphoribosyltransferase
MPQPGALHMTADEVDFRLKTIAEQIWDRHQKARLALIGIRRGGVPMAQRIEADLLARGADVRRGTLDITFHRDDLHNLEALLDLERTEIDIHDLSERCVILLDDVLFTGRTIRAAIDEILDFGRPKQIELAVLIDRYGRELPIQPDYPCAQLRPAPGEYVKVLLTPQDATDGVWIVQKKSPTA